MKILLANKLYYPKGGDCVYSLELEKLLQLNGHEVAFFAMQHPLNHQSKYDRYFPSTVDYTSKNFNNLQEQIRRPLYSSEVRTKFLSLLEEFHPDIVHVNNIHSQISPIIVKEAYKKKIPVIWTLHDYKLICPRYDSLRNLKPCELCYKNKLNVIRHKCLKNSIPASLLAYAESKVWNGGRLEKYTTKFITPSLFLKEKMISAGFSASKMVLLPNFINEKKMATSTTVKEDYYCFVGRMSKEKGIDILCEAARQVPNRRLLVVGTGPEETELKTKYASANIVFLGHKNWDEVQIILAKAKCMVVPSRWYENNPLNIIESLSNGTPVIGADIGGISESIQDGINGLLFEAGNVTDLKNKINFLFETPREMMNPKSLINDANHKYNPGQYYQRLIAIYNASASNNLAQD